MPVLKFKHIVSFSSQDKNHPADNLLKAEGTQKWKSEHPGEKHVSAVIQLEKSSQIHSIDIGNEGSAFVEVLVGRESASTDKDYQVLLVASSFMTPLESRNGNNRNAVRMFGPEKLSKASSNEKWDRIKVVCTQPFNKNVTYGLSFLRISSPSTGKEDEQEGSKKIGAFVIKAAGDDDITPGSFFANRGKVEKVQATPPAGAAAIRAASKVVNKAEHVDATVSKVEKINRPDTPPVSEFKIKRKHSSDDDIHSKASVVSVTPLRKQSTSLSSNASSYSSRMETPPPLKRTKTEPPKPSPAKIFSKLMEKVTFVLSGFQNPYRGELRDKAMEMGATYKPDWGKGCTHLICAFPNTPKYQQVEGRGYIVKKSWVLDCHKQKKLLSWRQYRLGDADTPPGSSSEEDEPSPKYARKKESDFNTNSVASTIHHCFVFTIDDEYGGDTDSGGDTDDEIRRAKAKMDHETSGSGSNNPYGDSTDEDEVVSSKKSPKKTNPTKSSKNEDDSSDSGLPELPEFFSDKMFFLYGEMSAAERRMLNRYIAAGDGNVSDYMNDKVNYVITSSPWDDNFDDALAENSSLVFVKPKWVYACHDKNKLVPYQPYVVVPD
ncbi:hypothetical protein ScPMuIL_006924 [Solemya velum]